MCSRCASCPGSVLHAQDVVDPRSNQTSTLPSSTSRITRGTLGSPPLYFCREICSFLFLVVFSQLEQFSKPLSSFSWQIGIGVLFSCRYACVFWAFYRYLTSTIPDIHSLVWLLLGECMSYVSDPRNEIINQKIFFSFSWLCSMSTPAHFILIWTFSYNNILGFNIWHPYSCVASYLSSPL